MRQLKRSSMRQPELRKCFVAAGKHQQIIVLTCRLRSFGPLGGHTLRIRTDQDCGVAA